MRHGAGLGRQGHGCSAGQGQRCVQLQREFLGAGPGPAPRCWLCRGPCGGGRPALCPALGTTGRLVWFQLFTVLLFPWHCRPLGWQSRQLGPGQGGLPAAGCAGHIQPRSPAEPRSCWAARAAGSRRALPPASRARMPAGLGTAGSSTCPWPCGEQPQLPWCRCSLQLLARGDADRLAYLGLGRFPGLLFAGAAACRTRGCVLPPGAALRIAQKCIPMAPGSPHHHRCIQPSCAATVLPCIPAPPAQRSVLQQQGHGGHLGAGSCVRGTGLVPELRQGCAVSPWASTVTVRGLVCAPRLGCTDWPVLSPSRPGVALSPPGTVPRASGTE